MPTQMPLYAPYWPPMVRSPSTPSRLALARSALTALGAKTRWQPQTNHGARRSPPPKRSGISASSTAIRPSRSQALSNTTSFPLISLRCSRHYCTKLAKTPAQWTPRSSPCPVVMVGWIITWRSGSPRSMNARLRRSTNTGCPPRS